MLSIGRLSKYYGGRAVLEGVSLTVAPGEKVGVIGRNGAGKSTLLRCLAGVEEPDEGERFVARGMRLGYAAQGEASPEMEGGGDVSVEAFALGAFGDLQRKEAELRDLERALADPARNTETLLERYGAALDAFERAGGYDFRARTRAVLAGLGFGVEDLDKAAGRLSGGERVRLTLAHLLLSAPDVLLLDEPTNHLDMEALEWLEGFLQRFGGAVVVVSHDRTFLDRVTRRTWEVTGDGPVHDYRGPYTRAMEMKEHRMRRQAREYEAYAAQKERLEAFVARYRAGTRARQAQDRLKKMARLEAPEAPGAGQAPAMQLTWRGAGGKAGRPVLRVEELAFAFSGNPPLFQGVEVEVRAGDRIALAGPNGAGKSTFLKLLVGELVPGEGTVEWAPRTRIGYFSQHRDDLPEGATVLEALRDRFPMGLQEARQTLAAFLFSGEQVDQPVESLSGGERSRLALLFLMLTEPDVLLLDEPTNHLDLPSRTALEEALQGFPGTLIAVSHDRYFLDRVTDTTWLLEGGRLVVKDIRLTAVREAMKAEARAAQEARRGGGTGSRKGKGEDAAGMRAARGRRLPSAASVEARIEALEREKADLEETLANPEFYRESGEDAAAAVARYEEVEGELNELYDLWLEVSRAE